jgi:hypothetical protein
MTQLLAHHPRRIGGRAHPGATGEYPNVQAFLRDFLGLDPMDAKLPLEVLINLHRMRVRGPFNILPYVGARTHGWQRDRLDTTVHRLMDRRFLALRGGRLFRENKALFIERMMWGARFERVVLEPVMASGNEAHDWLLIDYARSWQNPRDWRSWDPALLLYAVAAGGEARDIALPQLELELGTDPTVSKMLCWLADISRAEAEAQRLIPGIPLRHSAVRARELLQPHLHPSLRDDASNASG